jgi:ATP-dependent Clp protease ATP-binding subunit ClpC
MEATRRSERAILNEARAEAMDLRHGWIGAEHVLLALLNRRHHRASGPIRVHLSARAARREVVAALGRGQQEAQELSVTPRVQRVIGIVQGLAGERTRTDLPTLWLLALIDAGESVATSALERGGVDLKKLRAELVGLTAES